MATALLSFAQSSLDARFARSLSYMGGLLTFHADSQSTNGQFALMEFCGGPGGEPPRHVHQNEDELFYVLEGRLKVFRGNEELVLEPGDSAFLPRRVPHTFKILSSYARGLVYITPAGFEGYFRELGTPAELLGSGEKANPIDIQKIVEVAGRYGVTFIR